MAVARTVPALSLPPVRGGFDLIDRFNREPLTIAAIDPATNEPFPVIISGDRLIRLAESAFQSAALIPFLPIFVTTTAAGNTALLAAAIGQVAAPALYSPGVCASAHTSTYRPRIRSRGNPFATMCRL
jgi:hypothetical protein